MKKVRTYLTMVACLLVCSLPVIASAQDKAPPTPREIVPQADQRVDLKKLAPAKPKEGWFPSFNIGLNTSVVHTSAVPGIENGLTFSFGLAVNGGLTYLEGQHEWKSELKIIHTQTKTPALNVFVKTADQFDLKSFYTYKSKRYKTVGFFGGIQLNTQLFSGEFVSPTSRDITILKVDNTKEDKVIVGNNPFVLTEALSPMIIKALMGLDSLPFEGKFNKLKFRLSGAGQQVFANGFTLADDAATPRLEIKELQSYFQAGIQMNIALNGKVNKRLSYEFLTELMYPIVTSIDTELKGFDLLNADISFKLSLKLASWASLDYSFRAQKLPLLSEAWQVTNNLVLSLTANVI